MIVALVAAQICALQPAVGLVATGSHGGRAFAISAANDRVLLTWGEERRATESETCGLSSIPHVEARAYGGSPLAPLSAAVDVSEQPCADTPQDGIFPVAFANGNLGAANCFWGAPGGTFDCWINPVESPAPAHSHWHIEIDENGPGDVVATAVGNEAILVLPRQDSLMVFSSVAGARRLEHGEPSEDFSEGNGRTRIVAPAITPAGPDQVFVSYRQSGRIFGRFLGTNARWNSRPIQLSAAGTPEAGAPAVTWIQNAAVTVFAERQNSRQIWHVSMVRTVAGSPPVRSEIQIDATAARAPAIVPTTSPNCATLSWTAGTGHTSVVRMGRLCDGAIVPGSVVQVSQQGIEAGDSELAFDGQHTFIAWQELPPRAPVELRVARLSCP